jgi:hypothetical protein
VPNSRSERSSVTCPLVLDDQDLLREFELQDFFSYLLAQFYEVSNSRGERSGAVCPLVLEGRDLLQEFELQAFSSAFLHNPLKCQIPKVRDLVMCGLLIWMTEIYFGSSSFKIFLLLSCTILRSAKFPK